MKEHFSKDLLHNSYNLQLFFLDIQRSPRGIYSAEHFWKILNGARNRRQREDGELKSGLQSDSADGVR